jgi:hypothetical protein
MNKAKSHHNKLTTESELAVQSLLQQGSIWSTGPASDVITPEVKTEAIRRKIAAGPGARDMNSMPSLKAIMNENLDRSKQTKDSSTSGIRTLSGEVIGVISGVSATPSVVVEEKAVAPQPMTASLMSSSSSKQTDRSSSRVVSCAIPTLTLDEDKQEDDPKSVADVLFADDGKMFQLLSRLADGTERIATDLHSVFKGIATEYQMLAPFGNTLPSGPRVRSFRRMTTPRTPPLVTPRTPMSGLRGDTANASQSREAPRDSESIQRVEEHCRKIYGELENITAIVSLDRQLPAPGRGAGAVNAEGGTGELSTLHGERSKV